MARTSLRGRFIQFGKQTTWDTPVPATFKYPGNMDFTEEADKEVEDYPNGLRAPMAGQVISTRGGIAATHEMRLTFEDMVTFGLMGIKGGVTGVGGAADKTWTFLAPMSADPAPNFYTLEFSLSDFSTEYLRKVPNMLCSQIVMNIPMNGVCTMQATLWGGTPTIGGARTAALNPIATRESIKGNLWKLFIDTTAGAIGSTQKTDTLIGVTITIKGGIQPSYAMDGRAAIDATGYEFIETSCEIEMTYKSNANAAAELAAWRADTRRFIRLSATGSVIPTTAVNKLIQLDGCYEYIEGGSIGDENGQDTIVVKCRSAYDTTLAKAYELKLINGIVTAT